MPELVTAPTLREQVLTHLRDRIISGDLTPGALLTPSAVAKDLNTSAMPIREALRTLEQEGLVEVSGRRYTRVATPSPSIAAEAYPLLGLLEGHAIRQATTMPDSMLADAKRANALVARASNPTERMRAVFGFHRAICSTAGPITQTTLDTLYAQVGLLESVYARTYAPEISTVEHSEIIAALSRGDLEEAAQLTEEHWRHGYDAILPFLDKSLTQAPARQAAGGRIFLNASASGP